MRAPSLAVGISTPLSILIGHYLLANETSGSPAFAMAGVGEDDDYAPSPQFDDQEIDAARELTLRYLATAVEQMVADGYPVGVTLRFFGIRPNPALTDLIDSALNKTCQSDRVEGLYTIFDHPGSSSIPTGDCIREKLKHVRKPWTQDDIDRAWELYSKRP